MKAVLGKARRLSWFDKLGQVVDPTLLTAKVLLNNVLIATPVFVQDSTVPNLYVSQSLTFLVEAGYDVVVFYNSSTDAIDQFKLFVSSNHASDYPLAHVCKPYLSLVDSGNDETDTVSFKILPLGGAWTVSKTTSLVEASGAFVASSNYTFVAGAHAIVWFKVIASVVTPFLAQDVLVLNQVGKEAVSISVRTAAAPGGVPYTSTTVVASDADGVQLAQGVTGTDGIVILDIPPGITTFALFLSGTVFSVNNFVYEVVNTATEVWNNFVNCITNATTPTVTSVQTPASLCNLTVSLYEMDGGPIRHADIQIGLRGAVQLTSGAGVFGTRKVYKTDSNGHASFYLVQGTEIEVVMPALGLRRIVTVPSSAGPSNLLTLLSTAADQFDVITPNIATAPIRTL